MSEIKPIKFAGFTPTEAEDTTFSLHSGPYSAAADRLRSTLATTPHSAGIDQALQLTDGFLRLAVQLDKDYGADAQLPLADAGQAVADALRALAEIVAYLNDTGKATGEQTAWQAVVLGVGLWAMRHDLAITSPEPIVNALAERANAAGTRQDTAATFALMQGFIAHFAPSLGADLERSNPERPWRLLNLNYAITAIRSGDTALMRHAFDTLNAHLPEECAGFYREALALAQHPGFPGEARALIEAEWVRCSPLQGRTH